MKKFFSRGWPCAAITFGLCAWGILNDWSCDVMIVLLIVEAVTWALTGYNEGLENGKELS